MQCTKPNGHATTRELLDKRSETHGDYRSNARLAQSLKDAMRNEPGWERLSQTQRESLDLIATKISRILSGDPSEPDHWHDISGYALLPVKGD